MAISLRVFQGFVARLRSHLLPRVLETIEREFEDRSRQGKSVCKLSWPIDSEPSPYQIHFGNDRMYAHHFMTNQYTSYDVRRRTDVISSVRGNTSDRSTIMMLAEAGLEANGQDSDRPSSRFVYAQVLGIYHINIKYTGPGAFNYNARQFDFL